MKLPTLSYWQPWGSLIAERVKNWENRPRRLPMSLINKPMLIHASKRVDKNEWYYANKIYSKVSRGNILKSIYDYEFGGIIGWVVYDNCVNAFDDSKDVRDRNSEWFFGTYGYHVKDAGVLGFYPVRGMQGLFYCDYPDELITEELKYYLAS